MAVVDTGPEVRLRNWFDRPYDDAISAARTCYSPRVIDPGEITDGQRARIGPLTFKGGHHTVFQHATFEFALSGISRQLVWNFLHGFPYYNTEQQSQRYVRLDRIEAHVPPELAGEARAVSIALFSASRATLRPNAWFFLSGRRQRSERMPWVMEVGRSPSRTYARQARSIDSS